MTTAISDSSPDVIASFMQQVIVEYHNYGELHRRSEPRECVAIPVQIQRLDDQWQPIGSLEFAITRDLSCGGIGLFHSQPIDSSYLQIVLQSPQTHLVMRFLAKIEHRTRCGGFYIIGCRFVQREDS